MFIAYVSRTMNCSFQNSLEPLPHLSWLFAKRVFKFKENCFQHETCNSSEHWWLEYQSFSATIYIAYLWVRMKVPGKKTKKNCKLNTSLYAKQVFEVRTLFEPKERAHSSIEKQKNYTKWVKTLLFWNKNHQVWTRL